ncbi:23 kDa jasmonate-induced protein-like [Benincasa hispida]|uniref:23 kDa jasmonate-induced protein-like n=1 Tax=Benincasa hispida TaxID=102211 RepID=UPI0019008C64|nr:23 kDa jasmonate-induced protein-like [Benincasa hispida]XP_038879979.1 23 kDa jasmonate-induced protein-like [Benincasa hispida]
MEYQGKTITRLDRAKMALRMKSIDNKEKHARDCVHRLKSEWGTGVSTLCIFYNATGDTITLYAHHDWYGHIGPTAYPSEIANGQWGCFLHVKNSGATSGSCASVTYRGLSNNGEKMYWLVAWSNPWSRISYDNGVYTEVITHKRIDILDDLYDSIYSGLWNADRSHTHRFHGCLSDANTESSTSPVLEAVFSLYY